MIKATKSQYFKVARELKKKILNTPGEYYDFISFLKEDNNER